MSTSTASERVKITPELLADLEAKAKAATPGPWALWTGCSWRRFGSEATGQSFCEPKTQNSDRQPDLWFRNDADAKFIPAANPSVLLALVGRIRELERERELPDLPGTDELGVTLEQVRDGDTRIRQHEDVLIFSAEHRLWWKANASGYTNRRREAGTYKMADAYSRTSHCGPEKHIVYFRRDP
jgi:hypothetical protein